MITSAQCRAARALVEISRATLARLAGTEIAVVEQFERKLAKPDAETVSRIQEALESAGAVFIPESVDGSGAGVRLKFNSSSTRRLAILEDEGGIARPDDVP
ncbi:MAG: XRE family transcriptional regulator [Pseudomonadota bacterium]|nr:XRE family transcriptional regulator [Pseudomonadota bacterium]